MESHREMIRHILEADGFEVQTAATGQEALVLARDLHPDLILLDVMLPDTCGYDVCQELKMNPETMDVVVLLLSGLGSQAKERVAGLEWGADGYLMKPVDPEELVAHLHSLLRIRYVQEEARDAGTRAEEARARLAAIMEASEVAIIGTDLDGTVQDWNPAAERLFGYTGEEMRNASISRITPPGHGAEWQMVWSRVRGGEHVRGYDTVLMAKNGDHLPVFVNVCPIRDARGRVIGVTETACRTPLPVRQPVLSGSNAWVG
jgi:PAS domain S-box-containing protein